jgi:hypothetical protein
VTAEEFGLELSRYAQEYAERPEPTDENLVASLCFKHANQGLDEILIDSTGDMNVTELHIFHHWGVVFSMEHWVMFYVDETATVRVLEAMTDALAQLLGPDVSVESVMNRYVEYTTCYEHAMEVLQLYPSGTFEPHIKTPHGTEHPLQNLVKLLWKALTGNTACPEDVAHQLHLSYAPEYILCYANSLNKFAKGFRVTRT